MGPGPATPSRVEPKHPAMTEPLPTREVRSEAPVHFCVGHQSINWNSCRRTHDVLGRGGGTTASSSMDPSHQADAGAGRHLVPSAEHQELERADGAVFNPD